MMRYKTQSVEPSAKGNRTTPRLLLLVGMRVLFLACVLALLPSCEVFEDLYPSPTDSRPLYPTPGTYSPYTQPNVAYPSNFGTIHEPLPNREPDILINRDAVGQPEIDELKAELNQIESRIQTKTETNDILDIEIAKEDATIESLNARKVQILDRIAFLESAKSKGERDLNEARRRANSLR